MNEPKTYEEAMLVIADLQAKNAKVIEEKKEVLKMFDEKTLEGMGDNERLLAETLEKERIESAKLRKDLEDFKSGIEKEKTETQTKMLEERISKVAKGDKEFEAKLRANIDLLEKLPRATDAELDTLIDHAYKLTGQKEPNPLNNGSYPSNNTNVSGTNNFANTPSGASLASRIGLVVAPPAPAGGEGAK